MKSKMKAFASDNYAGVHPEVMQAIVDANNDHAPAYGNDAYTERAKGLFRKHLGEHTEVLFVFAGTGANVLGLDSITQPFQSIITPDTAHIAVDECGAVEKVTGSRLITVATPDGKLTPEFVRPHLRRFGDEHHAQPRVISVSQTTEYGTVYTPAELMALSSLAHDHGMLLHVDGARICNAAAALGVDFRTLLTQTGVDVVSFGGTKNGMMFGEAVVFMNPELAQNAKFYRKQNGQLASKQRFIAAQFIAMLEGDLWLRCARQANEMAKRLEAALLDSKEVQLIQPVQSNAIFAKLSPEKIRELRTHFHFYDWNELRHEVRWMMSFDTTEQEVDAFAAAIKGEAD